MEKVNRRAGKLIIQVAVKLIIRRSGEIAACPDEPLAELTMQDLPSLSVPS